MLDQLRSAQISSGGQEFGQKFSPDQRTVAAWMSEIRHPGHAFGRRESAVAIELNDRTVSANQVCGLLTLVVVFGF
jgi:hypothetical protein